MKIVSRVILVIGLLALIAAVVLWMMQAWEVYRQYLALDALRSREFTNPLPQLGLSSALGILAGLIIGLGLSLPLGRARREAAAASATQANTGPGGPEVPTV